MNDFELRAKLTSVPLPERSEEYWDDFPSRVGCQLRPITACQEFTEVRFSGFSWKLGVSFACVVVVLAVFNQTLKGASLVAFQKEIAVKHQLTLLSKHLHVLMADEHGMHYLVADKE